MRKQKVPRGALLAASLAMVGCGGEAREGGGALPPPSANLTARDSVLRPSAEIAPGVSARSTYRTAATAGLRVEVRDVEVAPGKTADLAFPGATILEIRSGKGSGRVAGKSRDIAAGGVMSQSQGDTITLANSAGVPLTVRVY